MSVSDVVLCEKLENNPEYDDEEDIEESKAAFDDVVKKDGFAELKGEFSLVFETPGKSDLFYEAFSKGNNLC